MDHQDRTGAVREMEEERGTEEENGKAANTGGDVRLADRGKSQRVKT